MVDMVRFPFAGGGSVVVEAVESDIGVTRVSRSGDGVAMAGEAFETALGGIRQAAEAVLHQFQSLASRPDEVSIEFGVRFSAQAGAIIAKTGVDSHLQVTLAWQRSHAAGEAIAPPVDPSPRQSMESGARNISAMAGGEAGA